MKRFIAFFLVLSLLLGSIITVSAQTPQELAKEMKVSRLLTLQEKYELNDDEEVRIIVELYRKPAIESQSARLQDAVEEIQKDQTKVMDDIKKNSIVVEYHHQFKNLVNGFSVTTTLSDAKRIEALPDVKRVYIASEYHRPEPEMFTSGDFIDLPEALDYNGKYTGEGTVVAIIDTGIDYTHKDMRLTNPETAKLCEEDVNDIVTEKGLPGQFYTEKVPYGYNYFDNNNEVIDIGSGASMHGMHVAGTVGANSAQEDGIKGVAPETQLLALKVFGNNPAEESTYGDMIIAAIDDAIALEADVINMSLGSPAAFVDSADLEQQAVQRASDNGVICVISAGNSGYYGDDVFYPFAENPDINMVGAPGLVESALQVASLENSMIHSDTINHNGEKYIYSAAGPKDPIQTLGTNEYEYVYCGLGDTGQFDGVYGKIALIQRGSFSFAYKVNNAYKNGAIAAVIYNHENGGDALVNMYVGDIKIPAIFIGHSNGEILRNSDNKLISFGGQKVEANSLAGEMSEFSSWGTVSTLDLKPEITAPGGQIYSTLNNNKYGTMSGTSMAAPHVSGVMALVTQRLNEEFENLQGADKVIFAKNLVMSSAVPHSLDGIITSPRQQGAGVINVYNAVSTPLIATCKDTGETEVELHEVGESLLFTITLNNYSNEDVIVYGSGSLMTQESFSAYGYDFLAPYSTELYEYVDGEYSPIKVELDREYLVPANGSIDVDVSIDIQDAYVLYDGNFVKLTDIYDNGTFIEGFIEFKSIDEVHLASIPYLGFYGEWDKAPILDGMDYLDDMNETFFGDSYFHDEYGRKLGVGSDGSHMLNNIVVGNMDNIFSSKYVIPRLTILRNAKQLKIMVLDSSKEYMKTIAYIDNVNKNTDAIDSISLGWDLTYNGQYVDDGQYYIRIVANIDYEGAEDQIFDYPVYVDHTMSTIEGLTLNEDTMKLTIDATEQGRGIKNYGVWCLDDNLDLYEYYFDTNVIDLSELEAQLYEDGIGGDYLIFPIVESMNGAVDIGDEFDLSLPIVMLPDEKFATFNEEIINLNVASESNKIYEIGVSVGYQMDPSIYGDDYYILKEGDMERVFYLDYDSEVIEFLNHETIRAESAGHSNLEAIYVVDDDMLDIVNIPYMTTSAVITTDCVVDITTDAIVKFVELEDLDGFKDGEDYFTLNADVIVFDTKEPIGIAENDNQPPTVVINTPEYKDVIGFELINYDKDGYTVPVTGTVSDDSALEYLAINGEEVDFNYNADEGHWEFTHNVPVDQQDHVVLDVDVSDVANNSVSFEHEFYVDTVDPTVISVNLGNNVEKVDDKYYLVIDEIKVADYLPAYDVYVNDNFVYSKYEDFKSYDEMIHSTPSVIEDVYVPINEGDNNIEIFVVDYVGNITTWETTYSFIIEDKVPPSFIEGYPLVQNIQSNYFEVAVKSEELGSVYYVMVKADEAEELELKAEDIINWDRNNYPSITGSWSGSTGLYGADGETILDFQYGIEASKDYKIFIVLEDEFGNVSEVKRLVITTLEDTSSNDDNTSNDNNTPSSGSSNGSTATGSYMKNVVYLSKEVNEQLKDENDCIVDVSFNFDKNEDSIVIKILSSVFNKLDQEQKLLGIKIDDAKVVMPYSALKREDSESVLLTVTTSETKTSNAVSSVYDFEFSLTNNKKEELNNFIKPITISIPVEISDESVTDKLAVYYLNEETNKWEIVGGIYDVATNSVIARVNHFGKYVVLKNSKSFEDIKGHWAQKTIEALASKGIINGKSVEQYDPEGTLTYAELIKLVVCTLGLPIEQTDGVWYEPYVKAALKANIITEMEAAKANETISRQNMTVILARALKTDDPFMKRYEPIDPITFIDVDDIPDDLLESIDFVTSTGILLGRGNDEFAPNETLTRAEVATIIYRLLDSLY